MMTVVIAALITLVLLVFIAWLGLKVRPRPFDAYPGHTCELDTFPLPDHLPPPVERFYRAVYGERIPIITSAVISGRARLRLFGLTFPGRFRFTHQAGQNYRHYLEATFFGLPLFKVNEYYLDGSSRLELPSGVVAGEPKIEQAANLGMWAEALWFPSLYLSDKRVRWQPVDEQSALLSVPYGEEVETFLARFDPRSGMLCYLECMRYKEAADEIKRLWINEALQWRQIGGTMGMAAASATWFDEGKPWVVFSVDELVYNIDVSDYVRARGV